MPKIMIIKYQQFVKTNTFSLSFHILFSPFFSQDISKSGFGDGQKWGWTFPPPPNIPGIYIVYTGHRIYKSHGICTVHGI